MCQCVYACKCMCVCVCVCVCVCTLVCVCARLSEQGRSAKEHSKHSHSNASHNAGGALFGVLEGLLLVLQRGDVLVSRLSGAMQASRAQASELSELTTAKQSSFELASTDLL